MYNSIPVYTLKRVSGNQWRSGEGRVIFRSGLGLWLKRLEWEKFSAMRVLTVEAGL